LWKPAHFPRVKELKSQCPYLVEPAAQWLSYAAISAEKAYATFLVYRPASAEANEWGCRNPNLKVTRFQLKKMHGFTENIKQGNQNDKNSTIKETLRLVRNYELIGIENLNLQGMAKLLRKTKYIMNTSWGSSLKNFCERRQK
jgi:hypothetical protein